MIKSVYEFTNYRKYLKHFFEHNKKLDTKFSLDSFAKLAKFSAKDFLPRVIKGEKNLSFSSTFKNILEQNCRVHK